MNPIKLKAPVLYKIAEFIQSDNLHFDPNTLHQAKRIIADSIGVVFSGIKTNAFKAAIHAKDAFFGKGNHTIWGTGFNSSLLGACFYNTLSIRSTDFDEGHRMAVGHPASSVVPAALLVGRSEKCSYDQILKSVIIGYEIATRFSDARDENLVNTYSSGRWAAIGTAASISYLLDLNIEQTMHALSNAWVLSPAMIGGTTDVSTGSMSKEGVAWAAQSGLQSTFLAKNGFVGPYLFVDAHDELDPEELVKDLGKSWLIHSNYFKPYACCRWLQSAASACEKLRSQYSNELINITSIEVEIFGRAIQLASSPYPENPVQAQFHAPFVVANILLYGQLLPAHLTKKNMNHHPLKSLVEKVDMIEKDAYNKLFPGKLPSSVTIKTIDRSFQIEVLTAPWGADNPPSDDALWAKFREQAGENKLHIWDAIMSGKNIPTID